MKPYRGLTLLLFLALLVASCGEKALDPQAEKEAVATLIERYVIANETQDLEAVHALWADDTGIVAIGTESGERLLGWQSISKAMQKQFRNFTDTYIAVNDLEVRMAESCLTAWFSATIHYNFTFMEEPMSYEDLRFTGVAVKQGEHWKLVQTHISVPLQPRNMHP
ncbi:MAG TPA: SgcJ/EcaC family oxidoreductase [Bacteroidales bacterium]|nr:SgcJ/EcaC family oxidoreductase [Bacteroidales bacterium]HRZ76308.1 SgcJ/EcaC family oxidoreductase [Bacteroidales bacterium]